MGNIFNDDFIDFLKALNESNVEYVLVGGYSVILHGYSRTTGDMDILVNKTEANYNMLKNAFLHFGMPMFDMTKENFLSNPEMNVFTFGRQPVAIDIMTEIKGADFTGLYNNATIVNVEGLEVKTIHLRDLIEIKKISGRHKDLDDVEKLDN